MSDRLELFEKAMNDLMIGVNTMSEDKERAEIIANVLSKTHPTLQQSFFRAFNDAMKVYSQRTPDLRNQQSIDLAKEIVKLDCHFPFV